MIEPYGLGEGMINDNYDNEIADELLINIVLFKFEVIMM
jgi:hypothetical protein